MDFLPPYSPELNPIERVWKLPVASVSITAISDSSTASPKLSKISSPAGPNPTTLLDDYAQLLKSLRLERQIWERFEGEFRAALASIEGNPVQLEPDELLKRAAPRLAGTLGLHVWEHQKVQELAAFAARNILAVTRLLHLWTESGDARAESHLFELIQLELSRSRAGI